MDIIVNSYNHEYLFRYNDRILIVPYKENKKSGGKCLFPDKHIFVTKYVGQVLMT